MKIAPSNESGNALWFILIAIALLTALTMTISRSSDTVESAGDIERMRVHATDMMRFAMGIEQAMNQMRMRGVSENEISFDVSFLSGYTNANCTTTDCLVFDVGGGGISYKAPPKGVNDGSAWFFTGANIIDNVGSASNDLVMILPRVRQALCARINTEMGIAGVPKDLLKMNIGTAYTGSFPTGETISPPVGEKTGCVEGTQDQTGANISGTYYFYHVLLKR